MESEILTWHTQKLLDFYDPVNNTNLHINTDTGIIDGSSGNSSYNPLRLSLKIKDNKINKHISVGLSYQHMLIVNSYLEAINENKIDNYIKKVPSNDKKFNKIVEFKNLKNNNYSIKLEDRSTDIRNVGITISRSDFLAIIKIINNVINNYSTLTYNAINVTNQIKIIKNLENLNELTHRSYDRIKSIDKTSQNTFRKNYSKIDNEYLEDVEENVNIEDINKTSNFKLDENEIDSIKLDNEEKINNNLDNIDNKKQKLEIRIKGRSNFIEGFLDDNLKNLYRWLDCFTLSDENSDDMTLLPFNMMISKAVPSFYKNIENLDNIYDYNYHILDVLKKSNLDYINDGEYKNYPLYSIKNLNIDNINYDMWNFTLDMVATSIAHKIFINQISKFNNINISKYNNVLFAEKFFRQILSVLLGNISNMDKFKKDLIEHFQFLVKQNKFDYLDNLCESLSSGGKLNFNISGVEELINKYLDVFNKGSKEYKTFDKVELYNINDLKNKLFPNKDNIKNDEINDYETEIEETEELEEKIVEKENEDKNDKNYIFDDEYIPTPLDMANFELCLEYGTIREQDLKIYNKYKGIIIPSTE